MGVIIKKIGKREYAYLAAREGKRVVHRYIGPAGSPLTIRTIRQREEVSAVPERFRTLFWDTRLDGISLRRNAGYVIERVLELGDMDAIGWLQRVYPVRRIIDVLLMNRNLTDRSRRFWMLWFGENAA